MHNVLTSLDCGHYNTCCILN
ncbi:hypothetical protein SPHINGOT1_270098 [Sphingomonas sp. T1]|nr:hypothetical protein SPHINGOT1_270098 [Sphingomonas sp. T1]